MAVVVGSTNPCKLAAVRSALGDCPVYASAEVRGFKASSCVSEQPRSQAETLVGARNRARAAFASDADVSLGVGVESGVHVVSDTMFDSCACVLFDGQRESVGWSGAFAIPPRVRSLVEQGHDLTQASILAGHSADENLGQNAGLIGILSDGMVDRLAYTKQAVQMATIALLKPTAYAPSTSPSDGAPGPPSRPPLTKLIALLREELVDRHQAEMDRQMEALGADAAGQQAEIYALVQRLAADTGLAESRGDGTSEERGL